jgi:signal peptidase I
MAVDRVDRMRAVRRGVGIACACLAAVIVFAFVAAGVTGALKAYRVPSGAMEPTLRIGNRIVADTWSSPHIGDIVVFHPPAQAMGFNPGCAASIQSGRLCATPARADAPGTVFVKRVVAGPGDWIAVRGGQLIRNGRAVREPYAAPCNDPRLCTFTQSIRVPPGYWYVLGDNRGASEDSRFWGPVAQRWIIGVVVWRYWPPSQFGSL